MRSMFIVAAAWAVLPQPVLADDVTARSIAATCAACHGTTGHSVTQTVGALAGRQKDDIVDLMRAFKTGKKPSTIMQQIAKGYTDEQIDLVAGYFAAQNK